MISIDLTKTNNNLYRWCYVNILNIISNHIKIKQLDRPANKELQYCKINLTLKWAIFYKLKYYNCKNISLT